MMFTSSQMLFCGFPGQPVFCSCPHFLVSCFLIAILSAQNEKQLKRPGPSGPGSKSPVTLPQCGTPGRAKPFACQSLTPSHNGTHSRY
jgi:hypothetical protein